MEEEEFRKRNTDCVYFLASPLTCKKGIDCEYRHNELARLNPRDCWYWLAGTCVNPTCAFRHPPLDVHTEEPSESASLSHQSSVPANKGSIPCYFFFNGFCNKGDKCLFLHGPDGNVAFGKPSKTKSAVPDVVPSENKSLAGNNIRSTLIDAHLNPSENVPEVPADIQLRCKNVLQLPVPIDALQQSPSPLIDVFESKEAAMHMSNSLVPVQGFIQKRSGWCKDQSSEEELDNHIDPEDLRESSPGFDVLVDDDKSQHMGYEDNPEYLLVHDGECAELNSHFLGYDFEDPIECNHMYTEVELVHEGKRDDSFDCLDNEHLFDNARKVLRHSRQRIIDTISSRKRKIFPTELDANKYGVRDLRECLRKSRITDGLSTARLPRRHKSSQLNGESQGGRRRHGVTRRLHGRLGSEVGHNSVESLGVSGALSNGDKRRGFPRHSMRNRLRQRYEAKMNAKPRYPASEISRKEFTSERISTQASSVFSGPKTLSQIREERRKKEENRDCCRKVEHSNTTASADFQGPKPLTEILKNKRRLCSVVDGDISSS
ncbi:zinc finger CCCH domain-containing protein 34-like isoform X2 [Tripterygium wilfordii]|uniref:Zinc finger CCCH domain-containing protein 34-like isoform X2 n=1 Tax=Tripterygium wilfordii TaxID=458696 RepID=A0A7J7DTF0_TRIWF|nr:zinc finger CCCH domain-containing protein 34-like [Tripterygium wilfordii]KAF5749648.1 zinc finger CCCH domain-containing protein 34-like isoform X2 [Tripterygium wilfordii]